MSLRAKRSNLEIATLHFVPLAMTIKYGKKRKKI